MTAAWLSIAVFALLAGPALAETPTMSLDETRKLAESALPKEARKLPGLTLTPGPCEAPCRCRTFNVLWSNPAGSPHCCFYTVDTRTGEVWEPFLCRRATNRALAKAQRAIRKRLGVTELEHRQALKSPPADCCWGP